MLVPHSVKRTTLLLYITDFPPVNAVEPSAPVNDNSVKADSVETSIKTSLI